MIENKKKVDEIYQLVKSNNKMLHSIKRNAFLGRLFKLAIYAVILGIPVYLYLTVFQPMLGNILDTYSQIQQTGNQIQGVTNSLPIDQLQDLLQLIPSVNSQ